MRCDMLSMQQLQYQTYLAAAVCHESSPAHSGAANCTTLHHWCCPCNTHTCIVAHTCTCTVQAPMESTQQAPVSRRAHCRRGSGSKSPSWQSPAESTCMISLLCCHCLHCITSFLLRALAHILEHNQPVVSWSLLRPG